ncbi:MAG: hypothetical protein O7E52_15370 [Candidatus Poribacteria bacterium]|nr:hypothetical protein [Candidatus Poribacteria bacterium]
MRSLSVRWIDVKAADAICRALVGTRDFSSFQRTGSDRINPVCEVYRSHCWREGDLIYFEIEADAFLRGMVRTIVGSVLKLCDCADAVNRLYEMLEARKRSAAGASVPARGLSLMRVKYGKRVVPK